MTEHGGLREAIAIEAARLLLRRKVSNYAEARTRASRWLSRRRVTRDEMPGRDEIEEQLYVLAGLESAEHHEARLREARLAALELGEHLANIAPRFAGAAVLGPIGSCAELVLLVDSADVAPILARLRTLPGVAHPQPGESDIRFTWKRRPALLLLDVHGDRRDIEAIDLDELRNLVRIASPTDGPVDAIDASDTADLLAALFVMLARLEGIRLDPAEHPEGDALYHVLQVFDLGREAAPWDEEFLLACLLHDVGLAIEPRHPIDAALESLDGLVTERTLALIEGLPRFQSAQRAGSIPRSLRRSEHFDDLLLLARCDANGRRPGADPPTLEEALEYIAGLATAWDDA